MKKIIVFLLVLLSAAALISCRENTTVSAVQNTYTGTLNDLYEVNGKTYLNVHTEIGDVVFVYTANTEMDPIRDVIPGQRMGILCEEYSDTDYRPVLTRDILPLGPVND